MGAYSTDDMLPPELEKKIQDAIVRPTLAGLEKDAIPYKGFLYFGLMLTPEGPKVLEYNCRLGDPETQAILLRADFDLAEACLGAARGSLERFQTKWKPGASVCVVVASEGYPASPKAGRFISGLKEAASVPGAVIFHAGTRQEGGKYYTSGGRVLGVGAIGRNLSDSCSIVYDSVSRIGIDGAHYRKDIGRIVTKSGHTVKEAANG